LCRPIFNEVVSSGSSLANDDSSLEDITSGSDQDHNKPILATTTKSMVQRTERSYGGRKRPYVILELLQDSSTFMSATKPKEIVDDDDNEPMLLPVPSTPLANISLPRQISILRVEDPATDGTCSSSSGEKPAARKKHRRLFPGKTKQERLSSPSLLFQKIPTDQTTRRTPPCWTLQTENHLSLPPKSQNSCISLVPTLRF
jgi:hypothetical protein